ncbi:carboxypeptidase 2 [Coccidioides immitis RMSCC 2394]|nr:carboxypeptidase 2 [Coccidioides immitis RMSCC 2394]
MVAYRLQRQVYCFEEPICREDVPIPKSLWRLDVLLKDAVLEKATLLLNSHTLVEASIVHLKKAVIGTFLLTSTCAFPNHDGNDAQGLPYLHPRLRTIRSNTGASISFTEPGKAGICETTPGLKSYSGYINLSCAAHMFFMFFEARQDPHNAPTTLWLGGGPGSLGPCGVTEELATYINHHPWTEVSNLLVLWQPIGVGFSHSSIEPGSLNPLTRIFENASFAGVTGRYPVINDANKVGITQAAAKVAWDAVQAFYVTAGKAVNFSLLVQADGICRHYGPTFFRYFYHQNTKIINGKLRGQPLVFDALGIINGAIDTGIEAPYFPEIVNHNTYNTKGVNQPVYDYMKFANSMPGGCQDKIKACRATNYSSIADFTLCVQAVHMCNDNVGSPYLNANPRNMYDIRITADTPPEPDYLAPFFNKASTRKALGVALNWASMSYDVYYAF